MTFSTSTTAARINTTTAPNFSTQATVKNVNQKAVTSTYGKTTTTLGKVSGYIIGAAFMTLMGIGANTSQSQVNFKSKTPENRSRVVLKSGKPKLPEDGIRFTALSEKLQKSFSFNTAQWAWILKVERKTLYNWINKPNVKIHSKASERLLVLDKFNQEMTTAHRQYFSKLTFGKMADTRFIEILKEKDLNLNGLVSTYEDLYTKFDGLYKRQKIR